MLPKWAAGLLAALAAPSAQAGDLVASFGATRVIDVHDTSFGARLAYQWALGTHVAASVGYANEGHVPGHHRDGLAVQLWLVAPVARGFELAAGAGPYQYFDTAHAESRDGFRDSHGTGLTWSLAATWRPADARWFLQLRLDHNETRGDLDSTMALLGVGWRLDPDGPRASAAFAARRDRDDEVTLYAGQTIVNSFESQRSTAAALEYRRSFGPFLRASATWLHEGDARLIRRDGLVTQGWIEPRFAGDRWTLGVGAGAYFAADQYRASPRHVIPITSITTSFHPDSHWSARLTWSRVVSNNDRDSDVLLLGAGYRF